MREAPQTWRSWLRSRVKSSSERVISLTFISLFAKNPKTMSQERCTYLRGIKKKPRSHEKETRIKSQQPRAALVFLKTLDLLLLSNSELAFLAVVENLQFNASSPRECRPPSKEKDAKP